jgi:ABC-2 type transport system permease protein
MKKLFNTVVTSKFGWLLLLAILFAVNFLASSFHTRFDLTKEKRYTLSRATERLLKNLNQEAEIEVFLKGDFPAGFRKLANSTREFLQLLKDENGSKLSYKFISPLDEMPGSSVTYGDSLVSLGAVPINLTVQKEAGQSSNIIFPVAVIKYGGKESLINLYPGASGRISQEEINSAEALMEYQFVNALDKMTRPDKPSIGYAIGNGEPVDARTYDLVETLRKDYNFQTFNLQAFSVIPEDMDALLIVKPTISFTEEEKFKIDQYVMHGGKLLCFIDNLIAEQDSLSFKPETIAYDRNLNLTDIFFRYGLRINTDLVMDLQCDVLPFVVGGTQENPQYEFLKWNYFPLFMSPGNQSSMRNLGYVASRFANSIDTIKVAGVVKTPLLTSSPNSRIITTPALISLNENKNAPEDAKFKRDAIPVAMLLEGQFTSLYKNRATRAQMDTLEAWGSKFNEKVPGNKMIIVSDGDIVLNEIIPSQGPLPMGWNKFTYSEYQKQSDFGKLFLPVANREFLLNCLEYLVNDPSISQIRNKDIVLRLLDSQKVKEQKTTWQMINIALPILLIVIAGWIYQQVRRRKYA